MSDEPKDPKSQTAARVAQSAERELHLKHLQQEESVRRVIAESTVQFKNLDAVFQGIPRVVFDADGNPLSGGRPLADVLIDYSTTNPHNVAGSVAETHDKGESTVRAKSDLKDAKAKSDFISAHGFDRFARLPATRTETQQVPVDELSWAQYQKLSRQQKMAIIETKGQGFVARLQHRAGEQQRLDRLVGKPQR